MLTITKLSIYASYQSIIIPAFNQSPYASYQSIFHIYKLSTNHPYMLDINQSSIYARYQSITQIC